MEGDLDVLTDCDGDKDGDSDAVSLTDADAERVGEPVIVTLRLIVTVDVVDRVGDRDGRVDAEGERLGDVDPDAERDTAAEADLV